ncbi:hypothetical protein F7Q99_31115 [Streptomyces kaniharaensis]|uniref:Uncharacterized protein n=1 Tax=Streptomyces kaniharaensis TaxID=212423 RepID=A0A6N7L319_9ACTN|nr:hypothetical protein [Streptomyces kaniharaensis]MQS15913.1 hypothetical protein [Streptomyces kaniharaensis]MQS16524.1 hypothetical protein [Streptomyces kaniharaensis]
MEATTATAEQDVPAGLRAQADLPGLLFTLVWDFDDSADAALVDCCAGSFSGVRLACGVPRVLFLGWSSAGVCGWNVTWAGPVLWGRCPDVIWNGSAII